MGRCQIHDSENGKSSMMHRMLKYAIRPVSPTTEYVNSIFHIACTLSFDLLLISIALPLADFFI